jgi:flagellar biosynthetic protein FliP
MQHLTLDLGGIGGPEQIAPALKVLLLFTVLSLAPAILISMTAFTRIVIVLSFVRQAVGSQNLPPMQVIMSLSLLLTFVVMGPVAQQVNSEALQPYQEKKIDEKQAFEAASRIMRGFLIPQTRKSDLLLFYELNHTPAPKDTSDVSMHLLVPAFMISELRTGFEMGFLIFLPFVLIDLIVASILTAVGMVMLPPTMLTTPLKLLVFVLVDGWALLTRSVVMSFS